MQNMPNFVLIIDMDFMHYDIEECASKSMHIATLQQLHRVDKVLGSGWTKSKLRRQDLQTYS